MKSIVKTVAMMAIVCIVALKAYNKQNEAQVSDVVLANVEAMASDLEVHLPPVVITCSIDCNDGIGQCWVKSEAQVCVRSGFMADHCFEYPCR